MYLNTNPCIYDQIDGSGGQNGYEARGSTQAPAAGAAGAARVLLLLTLLPLLLVRASMQRWPGPSPRRLPPALSLSCLSASSYVAWKDEQGTKATRTKLAGAAI